MKLKELIKRIEESTEVTIGWATTSQCVYKGNVTNILPYMLEYYVTLIMPSRPNTLYIQVYDTKFIED